MRISTKKYAIALYESLKDSLGKNTDEIIRNFVHTLAHRGILGRADKIIADFIKYYNAQEGITRLEITSANGLDGDQENTIIKLFEKALGKKIELQKTIDKNILGGIVVKYDDKVVDGSIAYQLGQLRKELQS